MPNRLIPWNSTSQEEGNPTKSIEVNDLIKRVKKKKVHKQGVVPQSRRVEAAFLNAKVDTDVLSKCLKGLRNTEYYLHSVSLVALKLRLRFSFGVFSVIPL